MAMSNYSKSSAATISASAAPGADFKKCCMPSGRFDGSDRDHYFQGVMQLLRLIVMLGLVPSIHALRR